MSANLFDCFRSKNVRYSQSKLRLRKQKLYDKLTQNLFNLLKTNVSKFTKLFIWRWPNKTMESIPRPRNHCSIYRGRSNQSLGQVHFHCVVIGSDMDLLALTTGILGMVSPIGVSSTKTAQHDESINGKAPRNSKDPLCLFWICAATKHGISYYVHHLHCI